MSAKLAIQALTVGNLGADVEDMAEAAQARMHAAQGAKAALLKGKGAVHALLARIDDVEWPDLQQAQAAKDWVMKAEESLENLALQQELVMVSANAEAEALKKVVGFMGKKRDGLVAKLEAAKGAENGEVDLRGSGHPGLPIKAQRAAEDAEQPSESSSEEQAEEAGEASEEA